VGRGFKDRDGKFVKEFQTTFDSSFWELYLFAVMKHFHLDVDFSFNAPDFVIANRGGMSVEATVTSHAQGSTPESVKPGAPIPDDLNEFNRQTIIRISNSLAAKRRKYIESYAGLAHVQNRPFVLAVSAFDRPFAMLGRRWNFAGALQPGARKHIVPLENLEMSERKGIIFLCSSWGMLFPQPDHEGQTVGGPG